MISRDQLADLLRLRRGLTEAERRLSELEKADRLHEMLKSHIAFLDYLSLESRGKLDYRTKFTTWYLTRRPKGTST